MTTKNIPRVSFNVMEKQMTQMLRFKVKTTRTKQQFGKCCKHCFYNTLMASFCMERLLFVKKFTLYFRRFNFFLWSIVIVLLLQQVHCQKPPVYTAKSCSNESVFFFLQSQNKLRSSLRSNKAI